MSHMVGGSSLFTIKKENIPKVLSSLYDAGFLDDHYEHIERAFHSLGWDVSFDSRGNVVAIYHEYGLCSDEDDWLQVIAPYVEPGCYLSMENDDNYLWAWYFDGNTCTEYAGELLYPGMPDYSRRFIDERDPETPIPISQLKCEYAQRIIDGELDPAEVAFNQYLHNCMSHQGGTLTEMK